MQIALDSTMIGLAVMVALCAFLLLAVWHDLKRRRIPNAVVFTGAALALILHSTLPAGSGFFSADPGARGFLHALAGLGVGFVLLLPLYLLRAAGAGDVKLMAMVGAFAGPLDAAGAVICTFLAGALMALVVARQAGVLRQMAHNLRLIAYSAFARLSAAEGPVFDARTDSAAKLPYALAIAAGSLSFLALRQFG